MVSNADIEMRWVEAWNDLSDIVADRLDAPCQLPDGSVVTPEECRGWLQDSVYAGYHVRVKAGWVGHRHGVVVERWRGVDA
jgi:hypothetical protein